MNFIEKLFRDGRHISIRVVCYECEYTHIDTLIPEHIRVSDHHTKIDEQNQLFEEGWKILMINWYWFGKYVL